ncbi:hypothetical protein, partial [Microcoleus sp. CAWBG52]|uniref:hypothetical protein n=1 Tax=Microcoleus sp. CAWBG52 TaxID=2841649 RepID=UPI0025EB9B38
WFKTLLLMKWIIFQYGLLNAFDEFHLTIFWQYSHFGQVRFFSSQLYWLKISYKPGFWPRITT